MPHWPFIPGKLYERRAIHTEFGGQSQGGISTPADFPVIFVFMGKSGAQHGYDDKRHPDGSISYFGEGQSGDMVLKRGNRAIAGHVATGKDLLLFEATGKGKPVRFEGQFVCQGYDEVSSKDSDGITRKAIVFDLAPIEAAQVESGQNGQGDTWPTDFRTLRELAYRAAKTPSKKTKTYTVSERSSIIRAYALTRAGGRCESCCNNGPFLTLSGQPYLEVHHLRRLTDGGPDSPAGVAAICPTCHREIHHGQNGAEKNLKLSELIQDVEKRTFKDQFPDGLPSIG